MSPRRPAPLSLAVLVAGCAAVAPSEMPPVPPQEAFREVLTGATRFGVELGEPLDEALRPEPGQDRARVPYKSDHPLWTVRVHCRGGWDGPVELLEAVATEEHVNDVPDWEAYLGVRRGRIVGQVEGRFRSKWGQSHRINERHDLLVVATDRPNVYLAYQGHDGFFYSALVTLDDEALRRRGLVPFEQVLARARANARAGSELDLRQLASIQLLAPDTPGIADDVEAGRQAVARARQSAIDAVDRAWAARREAWTKGDARQRLALWSELRLSLPEPPVMAASHRRQAILAGLRDELLAAAQTEAGRGWDRAPAFVWAQVLLEPTLLDDPAALLVALDRAAAFDQMQGVVAAHVAVGGLRLGKIGFRRGDLEGRWRALVQAASGRRQAALRAAGKLEEAALEAGAAGTSPFDFSADRFAKMTERMRQLEPLRADLDAQVAWHHAHQRDFVDGNRIVDPMWGYTTSMMRQELSRRLDADAAEHLAAGRLATAAGRWLEGMSLRFGGASPAPLRGLAEVARAPEAPDSHLRAAKALLPVLVALDPPLAPGTDGARLVARLREPPLGDRPAARLLGLEPAGPGDLLEAAGLLGLEVGHCRLVAKDGGYDLVAADAPPGPAWVDALGFAASPLFGVSEETRRESERLRTEDAWLQQERAALDESRAWIEAERARLDALKQALERARAQGTLPQHEAEIKKGAADERVLGQRIDAHNARVTAREARTAAYNAAVGPFNARLSKERYGPLRDLRARLDAALRGWLAARLATWAEDLRARRPGDPGLDREVAWARWFVLGDGAGPALGALGESHAFAERRAAWLAEEAFHQPSEPEVARMVVEFLRRSRSAEKRDEVVDHYVRRYDAKVLRAALAAADLAGLTSLVDAALERRDQQQR
ncbi:MAG: hypothetical protein M9894_12905 [Planctomycetes bacterium]|nr:hypothetical protein [Planctomycetota bacterium]